MTLDFTNFTVSWMKKTVIVDVVIVNSVIRLKGRERGSESRGGAVATKQGTRVDGDSPL